MCRASRVGRIADRRFTIPLHGLHRLLKKKIPLDQVPICVEPAKGMTQMLSNDEKEVLVGSSAPGHIAICVDQLRPLFQVIEKSAGEFVDLEYQYNLCLMKEVWLTISCTPSLRPSDGLPFPPQPRSIDSFCGVTLNASFVLFMSRLAVCSHTSMDALPFTRYLISRSFIISTIQKLTEYSGSSFAHQHFGSPLRHSVQPVFRFLLFSDCTPE